MKNEMSDQDFKLWHAQIQTDLAKLSSEQLYHVLRSTLHVFREKLGKARGKWGARTAELVMDLLSELDSLGI